MKETAFTDMQKMLTCNFGREPNEGHFLAADVEILWI